MDIPRDHHTQSRFYLNHFTDPADRRYLWVYTKDGDEPTKTAPKSASVIRDYHTVVDANGVEDASTLESLMQKIEWPASKVFRNKLSLGLDIAEQEKNLLASFIGLSWVRASPLRESTADALVSMLKEAGDFVRGRPGLADATRKWLDANPAGDNRIPEPLARYIVDPSYPLQVPQAVRLSVFTHLGMVARTLAGMRWQLVSPPPEMEFLTSDNPVSIRDQDSGQHAPYVIALFNPRVQVTFPLLPTLALVASPGGGADNYRAASRWLVARINRQTLEGATECYASTKSGTVRSFAWQHLSAAAQTGVKGPRA